LLLPHEEQGEPDDREREQEQHESEEDEVADSERAYQSRKPEEGGRTHGAEVSH
jgi:hypothetical protein